MTDKTTDENSMDLPADDVELKKRLIRRVAAAGVLIAILLGGLAVLDNLNAPAPVKVAEEAPVQAVSEPKAQDAKPEEKAEEKPGEKPAEQAQLDEQKKVAEVPATPEETSSPAAPNKKGRPGRVERPLTKSAEPKLAMLKPSETVAALKPVEPATQLIRPPKAAAPASRPLTQPLVASQAGNFLLQMGVFNSTANAEELRAKLEINGIPSQIEARVQVGPFRTRLEAEQMRDKLKQLGMETGMVVAIKK
ncbi:MAG: SPOR domain-containing protein [Proteobacteria bacterium]|nr:SPOR domain-containing protein [Pseudomonadota bacterium]